MEYLYIYLASVVLMGAIMVYTIIEDCATDGYITLFDFLKYLLLAIIPGFNTFGVVFFAWMIATDVFEGGWKSFVYKLRSTKLFEKEVK